MSCDQVLVEPYGTSNTVKYVLLVLTFKKAKYFKNNY